MSIYASGNNERLVELDIAVVLDERCTASKCFECRYTEMRNAMSWIAMSNEMIGIRAEYRGTELRTAMSWIAMSRVQMH
jgi:hypothetical protein